MDFKNDIKENIIIEEKVEEEINIPNNVNDNGKIILKKKDDEKTGKRVVNIYMVDPKVKKLDKMAKQSNYSRNELINLMVDFCLDNWEVE